MSWTEVEKNRQCVHWACKPIKNPLEASETNADADISNFAFSLESGKL